MEDKSLERLYDYTKFHIGLYITLATSYLAVAALEVNASHVLDVGPKRCWAAVICFMIAGFAGGVVASSITRTGAEKSEDFLKTYIGPMGLSRLRISARAWTRIEHTAFWIGLVFVVFSIDFMINGHTAPCDSSQHTTLPISAVCNTQANPSKPPVPR